MEHLVSRTRFTLAFLFALAAVVPADAGPGGLLVRKPKVSEEKTRILVETLKSDPDEKKRKAAADELGGADPRVSPDVAPALVDALRKDKSSAVRVEAAEALRHLGEVFSQAGVALEAAVESDPAPLVRLAAKRTLWEYHLNGYRTAKGADGSAGQTIEPPIASPAGPRPVAAFIPAPPVVMPKVPPVASAPAPRLPAVASQPADPAPGPQLFWPYFLPGPRTAVRSALNLGPAPVPNLTAEPPVAKKPTAPPVTVDVPVYTPEPPLRLPPIPATESLSPSPSYVPTLPPFMPDLPSIVTPPDDAPILPVPKITPPPK